MSDLGKSDPIQGRIVHEYDGILEADNRLPNWWIATFFGTIAFAALYWFAYETWHLAPGPGEEYAEAMQAAGQAGGEVTDELLVALSEESARVDAGREAFASSCAACHGARAEGEIGPNLTDDAWIHGGTPTAIHATVSSGVPSAGMPAWGPVLGHENVQSLVAFLLAIRGTNVAGRPPQGEPYVPVEAPAEPGALPRSP